MNAINHFFTNISANPELRMILTIALLLIVFVAVWLLLRNIRLWYWKTDKMIDAINDMQNRMNEMEDNIDKIKISTDILMNNDYQYLGSPQEEEGEGARLVSAPLKVSAGRYKDRQEKKMQQLEKQMEKASSRSGENREAISMLQETSLVLQKTAAASQESAADSQQQSGTRGTVQQSSVEAVQKRKQPKVDMKKTIVYREIAVEPVQGRMAKKAAQKAMDARHTLEITREELAQSELHKKYQLELLQKDDMKEIQSRSSMKDGQTPDSGKETDINPELKGVEAALRELQKQKEQLEADLNARIRA